ncbi:xanthine dehydrogenase family protein molybdopterin-binding subunit [Pseudonocardia sp. CA-142604]|uniref:xanthine dehydrogenase family protein molybdopterin-binding subunit n=1 Tax=Pseudonocardia sp. CA-142604 TaxID=3240024 RepID=UPI003D91A30A
MNTVGQPIPRTDGRLKVTGDAPYTGDIRIAGTAHASIVHSTVANGRTLSIDTAAAENAPGVLAVFTHHNMPATNPTPKPWSHLHPHGQSYLPLRDEKIHYAGQPVVLVVADTLDQAIHAGTLVSIEYEVERPVVFGPETVTEAVDPPQFLWPVASSVGDADTGIAAADVVIEQTYTTADRHHNQMEPHATTAVWDVEGTLTLYETTQHIFGTKELVSIVLGIPPEKVNVVSYYLGGGFGGKAYVWPHTLMAALAAKVLNRPVKLQLTRAQMYSMVGHQPATIQTIALGADRDGHLTAIRHDSISPTSVFDSYIEYAAAASRSLWAARRGISTNHRVVHVNRNTPTAMRSPHEALGHFALESAMDELAYAAGVDPVALRLRNDTEVDPYSGRPFSTRALWECLTKGAERFGWDMRTPGPGSMRDGRHLIGQGVASAIYTHWRWPAKARVRLNSDGSALVETGTHELGTGTYTVMQQVAADALGLPPEKVSVRLGDTRLPESHASIGSATMANAGASVLLAAEATRDKAIELALNGMDAPFAGAEAEDVIAADGRLVLPAKDLDITYAELLARNNISTLMAEGDYDPVEEALGPKAVYSFSAVFAEVRVDPDLGLVRLNRFVGAYDAGQIINPKTARSQAIGGIIWGVGQALLEQSEMDPAMARFVNRNYSGYLVPTNADIPELDVIFTGEFDEEASPLGAKGLGELTAVSVAPAIANAVYHATGRRVRDLPITVEKIL